MEVLQQLSIRLNNLKVSRLQTFFWPCRALKSLKKTKGAIRQPADVPH
jgi:hypothetical protein